MKKNRVNERKYTMNDIRKAWSVMIDVNGYPHEKWDKSLTATLLKNALFAQKQRKPGRKTK